MLVRLVALVGSFQHQELALRLALVLLAFLGLFLLLRGPAVTTSSCSVSIHSTTLQTHMHTIHTTPLKQLWVCAQKQIPPGLGCKPQVPPSHLFLRARAKRRLADHAADVVFPRLERLAALGAMHQLCAVPSFFPCARTERSMLGKGEHFCQHTGYDARSSGAGSLLRMHCPPVPLVRTRRTPKLPHSFPPSYRCRECREEPGSALSNATALQNFSCSLCRCKQQQKANVCNTLLGSLLFMCVCAYWCVLQAVGVCLCRTGILSNSSLDRSAFAKTSQERDKKTGPSPHHKRDGVQVPAVLLGLNREPRLGGPAHRYSAAPHPFFLTSKTLLSHHLT